MFEMLDMVDSNDKEDTERKHDFVKVFHQTILGLLPGEVDFLLEEAYEARVQGGDQTLHLAEFGFFMVHQRCCPEFSVGLGGSGVGVDFSQGSVFLPSVSYFSPQSELFVCLELCIL